LSSSHLSISNVLLYHATNVIPFIELIPRRTILDVFSSLKRLAKRSTNNFFSLAELLKSLKSGVLNIMLNSADGIGLVALRIDTTRLS